MSRLNNLFQPLVLLAFLLIATPVLAHKIQVSGNVAATLHLEPNDNPKVGEPTLTWFALTRKGGHLIPLSQCNCRLSVYATPRDQNSTPLMQPSLKAINTERYKQIPGAEINFKQPGNYELELTGTPKAGASFKAFKLTYPVTVTGRSGTAPATHHR